jgi:basic membrane lipoprotein Med (substrate-binding protein (PBP1-ABC) superfamily)
MFMKKSSLIFLILILTTGFFKTGFAKEEATDETSLIVSMATDVGGLGDKSFNDGAYAGLLMAQDKLGVEPRVVESRQQFEVGFIAGARSVNPDVEVISVTSESFVDHAKGKEVALAMIEQGADIIFHAAGLTGLGAINACKEEGVLAIGVDVDQNDVAPDTVLTSAEKKIVQATYLTVESVKNCTFAGGNKYYGINEDAVGIASFHSFDSMVPQAVKDMVSKVTTDMKAGKVRVQHNLQRNGKTGIQVKTTNHILFATHREPLCEALTITCLRIIPRATT